MKKTILALSATALSLSLSLTACASAKKAESGAKDTSKTGAAGVPYLKLNNGAQSVMPPATDPWGQRTYYVADPDGNLIEIGSFVKE